MRLKVGDKIYLRPDRVSKITKINVNNPSSYFYKNKISAQDLKNHAFIITDTRLFTSFSGDDICITWIDGSNWWWGQIGESEPWTELFISETEYLRTLKLEELGI